jgi:hypothetical protein
LQKNESAIRIHAIVAKIKEPRPGRQKTENMNFLSPSPGLH